MRSPAERDQQTITIATALIIFVGVLGLGVLLGILLNVRIDVSERLAETLGTGLLIVASGCAIWYLIRHRR